MYLLEVKAGQENVMIYDTLLATIKTGHQREGVIKNCTSSVLVADNKSNIFHLNFIYLYKKRVCLEKDDSKMYNTEKWGKFKKDYTYLINLQLLTERVFFHGIMCSIAFISKEWKLYGEKCFFL